MSEDHEFVRPRVLLPDGSVKSYPLARPGEHYELREDADGGIAIVRIEPVDAKVGNGRVLQLARKIEHQLDVFPAGTKIVET